MTFRFTYPAHDTCTRRTFRAPRRIPVIDEGLDGHVVLRGLLPQSSLVAVRGSAAAGTRVRHQDRTMRHIVLEELFKLGHAHQRQSACLGEYRPMTFDFLVFRVPRQRRPLHEAERHPESHRTRANVVRQPLPPCKPPAKDPRTSSSTQRPKDGRDVHFN